MGMFDTIYFQRPYTCDQCGKEFHSVQTKAFERMLENFRVGDCVGHAEEVRIVTEKLFCLNCRENVKSVYLVVYRGILLGITDDLEEAKRLLEVNVEKMVLWYHDLHQRYVEERKERHSYEIFIENLREWYSEGMHQKSEHNSITKLRFLWSLKHLQGAVSPIESVERFMAHTSMRRVLNELQREGHEVLDIYYPEEMTDGEEAWSVDVYQDEINQRCDLNWTWTVISRKQIENEGDKEDELPVWTMVVDEPFSEEVVCETVEKWLRDRFYQFKVRMIPIEQAKGSGLVKKLRERVDEKEYVTMDVGQLNRKLKEEERDRLAQLVDELADRRKVFYYKGFYGSLVPDVESEKLVGKVEGIDESIVYEGETVRECEKKFKECVSRYTE